MRALAIVVLLMSSTAIAGPAPGPDPLRALTDTKPFTRRVHVTKIGAAGFGATLTADPGDHRIDPWDEQIVVGERADAVRLVVDQDDARVLLWISIDDVAWTVAKATRLVGRDDTGVWLLPGAPITVDDGGGKRIGARFDDGNIAVDGLIARTALTRTFPASRGPHSGRYTTHALWRDPAGDQLVRAKEAIDVRVIAQGPNDWRLVEHRGRYLRMVGWARTGELVDGLHSIHGTGFGSAYGMSDTARIDVPAGACLFDPDTGDVVGVQTAPSTRYVSDHVGDRYTLYVGSDWGLRVLDARVTKADPKTPTWATCPR